MTTESDDRFQHVPTRTGLQLRVRGAEPEDEAVLARMFAHVSPEELRFRFLTGLETLRHEMVEPLVTVDHKKTENFLAFIRDDPVPVASAMVAIDESGDRAEVAISVRGDHRNEGVGWAMLGHAAAFAEARGVRVLESVESRDNHAAIQLEREMGFTARMDPEDPGLMIVSKRLRAA